MLALVGSGEYLPGMDEVDRVLLNRLAQPVKVVCLPTAAGTEGVERIEYWNNLGVNHFTHLGVSVEAVAVTDRESANNQAFAERIAQANFVYLSGGKPEYLYNTLEGSLAWLAILGVLERGGLLVGCSAGAMILGEKFYGFGSLLPGLKPGFNLVPQATVLPHFDEISPAMVHPVRLLTGSDLTILGIEGYTALVQSGNTYEVLGRGGVTVWNQTGKQRYLQGPLPGWAQ